MATGSVQELAKRAHLGTAFTRQAALAAGITRKQLRGASVKPVFRGVFTLVDDRTRLDVRAGAALRLAGPGSLVCDVTGLALLGVYVPDALLQDTVHVWVPAGVTGPRMGGIRVHRGRPRQLPRQVLSGVAAASPAECWLQAARWLPVHELVVLADGLMRRHDPILFLHDLRDAVAGAANSRGVRAARAALELAREGTDSPKETDIRLALVDGGLPCPEVNHPLWSARGTKLYSLDMAYPEAKVGVEYDGAGHAEVMQMRRDQTRRRWIEDRGWRLITATAGDLGDLPAVVDSVRHALEARGAGRRN